MLYCFSACFMPLLRSQNLRNHGDDDESCGTILQTHAHTDSNELVSRRICFIHDQNLTGLLSEFFHFLVVVVVVVIITIESKTAKCWPISSSSSRWKKCKTVANRYIGCKLKEMTFGMTELRQCRKFHTLHCRIFV